MSQALVRPKITPSYSICTIGGFLYSARSIGVDNSGDRRKYCAPTEVHQARAQSTTSPSDDVICPMNRFITLPRAERVLGMLRTSVREVHTHRHLPRAEKDSGMSKSIRPIQTLPATSPPLLPGRPLSWLTV